MDILPSKVTKSVKVMRERKIEQNNTGASLEQFPKPLWHEDLAKWNRTRKNICKDEDKILSKREWFEYQSVRRSPWVKEWSPQILFIDWPLWSGYRKSSVMLRHSFVRKIWSSKKKNQIWVTLHSNNQDKVCKRRLWDSFVFIISPHFSR